jgi:hypothetical protein
MQDPAKNVEFQDVDMEKKPVKVLYEDSTNPVQHIYSMKRSKWLLSVMITRLIIILYAFSALLGSIYVDITFNKYYHLWTRSPAVSILLADGFRCLYEYG